MKTIFTLVIFLISITSQALDPNHFTVTRISAPYFVVDGNSPATITKAYVGFEIKNNSNSATTYSGIRFTVTSITSSVVGQTYSILSPTSGQVNVGTLAPGQSKVCYFYVSYPASVTPAATFNVQLSDNTAGAKTQSFVISNRSSISANAGGTATQSFTNQDLIGGIITDDVTYAVGNVQNNDEADFQVSVSANFDATKMTLLATQVISSTVPGVPAGTTDSLYFITGNGSNGASVTIRWTFRISGYNFTNYVLPCAGATSGNTNYKYALNTALGAGTPVVVSSAANPLTITKTSDKNMYRTNATATFTITITNPGAYGVTIDKIVDQLPAGFSFLAIDGASNVTAANSTAVPATNAVGTINFEGGVNSGSNTSYYVPAGSSIIIRYTAKAPASNAVNLSTTVRDYIGTTEVGSGNNTVGVSATLPVTLTGFRANIVNGYPLLQWSTAGEINVDGFQIERSVNNQFDKIGFVPAAGNGSSYSFIDSFAVRGNNYYRLKLTDRDGQFTYSAVVLVNWQSKGFSVQSMYPVPVKDGLTINLTSEKNQQLNIRITDVAGRLLQQTTRQCVSGANLIQVNNLGTLTSGQYFITISTDELTWHKIFMK